MIQGLEYTLGNKFDWHRDLEKYLTVEFPEQLADNYLQANEYGAGSRDHLPCLQLQNIFKLEMSI